MTDWITADLHFGHDNIIRHCNRPFVTSDDMDEILIDNWNDVVSPNDHVWVLGDFAYRSKISVETYRKSLNGHISVVLGNHDKERNFGSGFREVCRYKEIAVNGVRVILFHWPIESWQGWHRGSIHLHGHSHGTLNNKLPRRMDVGVDCCHFAPQPLEEIVENLK